RRVEAARLPGAGLSAAGTGDRLLPERHPAARNPRRRVGQPGPPPDAVGVWRRVGGAGARDSGRDWYDSRRNEEARSGTNVGCGGWARLGASRGGGPGAARRTGARVAGQGAQDELAAGVWSHVRGAVRGGQYLPAGVRPAVLVAAPSPHAVGRGGRRRAGGLLPAPVGLGQLLHRPPRRDRLWA